MKVIYKNMEVNVDEGSSVLEYFKDAINANKNIIACIVNNEVKSLNYILQENDEVELLDTTTRDGARIYTRGLLYIMSMAFDEIYPEIELSVNYQLSSSMFCKTENSEITEEMLENIRAKMQEIINENIQIKKVQMSKREALELMRKEKTLVGIAQIENKQKEDVSFYFCKDYYNYFFGVMPISTGYIQLFDIMIYILGSI